MGKRAISITLRSDNLTWLRASAGAGRARSVSDLIDQLVSEARARGVTGQVRTVVGTVDIDASDPLLLEADAAVREAYERALQRPMFVKETGGPAAPRKRTPRG